MDAHWRDIQKSDYLASWDFQNPSEELTIKEVKNEVAQLQKKENKVIAHFVETHLKCGTVVKPMILNNTNLKFLQEKTGIFHQSQWNDLKIEVSVIDNKSAIGGKKRLVISKLLTDMVFNIEKFLLITDSKEARKIASAQQKFMTESQINQAKQHLESLK